MVKEIEQVSNAKISLGTTRGGGPKSLILVEGSSLAHHLHLNRIINLLCGLPLCLREGDHLFVKLMFNLMFKRVIDCV